MKNVILMLFCFLLINACSTEKVTHVKIINNNAFPISVNITTNNVKQSFTNIKPNETFEGIYNWTNLNKEDGQWQFDIINDVSKGMDSYKHGYFSHGELYNFLSLQCKGDQLKVDISQ